MGTTEATISRFKMNTRYDITTLFIISRGIKRTCRGLILC
ncbi:MULTISPECIES: hypothetical protein [Bacillus]|nr:hypothetical protein [Bacillus haynesii]UIN47546.1 hypothetical protein LXN06_07615 [Bacillus licheniformis]MCY7799010.1 hypothetical protein [Bacillus haynesii]MCY7836460.1 hypothetical protein [Bacillus haynesii]MCY7860901.1 hypothetical protein [Bacillus haynesii]MCY8217190.1 hypothetical protein [Bacillus haynesii]